MESPSGIAELAVQSLEEGCLEQYSQLVCDLEQVVGAKKVRVYLARAGAGLAFLKRADRAATAGDTDELNHSYSCARRYIDEDEIAALTKEHRLCFSVPQSLQTVSIASRIKLSFADVH